jgi:hypothetical protein
MSSWYKRVLAAPSGAARIGVLAGLLGAGLMLGPARAGAAEQPAAQAGTPSNRVSPYTRYARDHFNSVEKKPARVKLFKGSAGNGRRVGARGRR